MSDPWKLMEEEEGTHSNLRKTKLVPQITRYIMRLAIPVLALQCTVHSI